MKKYVGTLMIGLVVIGPLSAAAQDLSASIPSPSNVVPLGRQWQGTAEETPGIYSGPVKAMVTLQLNPDGTYVETWKEGDKESATSGTWRTNGNAVVLESADRSHARLTLQQRGETLYTVATARMPKGRETTTAIDLQRATD
jgi:hypothetical protein